MPKKVSENAGRAPLVLLTLLLFKLPVEFTLNPLALLLLKLDGESPPQTKLAPVKYNYIFYFIDDIALS